MIDCEPPDGTLSDEHIAELLRHESVDIARRTVAKYRTTMRIPSSDKRHRIKQRVFAKTKRHIDNAV